MTFLLTIAMALIWIEDVFLSTAVSVAGLSIKNIIVILVVLFSVARILLGRRLNNDIPTIYLAFAVLLIYATTTAVIVSLAATYPNYSLTSNLQSVKRIIFDNLVFFTIGYLAIENVDQGNRLRKAFLIVISASTLMSILPLFGVNPFGTNLYLREDGRVTGWIHESNQFGGLLAFFAIPVLAEALSRGTKGLSRLAWLGAFIVMLAGIALTYSRGAILGFLIGFIAFFLLIRNEQSHFRLSTPVFALLLILSISILAVVTLSQEFLAADRMIYQTFASDIGTASSGRTEIWGSAISKMAAAPWSFITGFGWGVYYVLPRVLAPHNEYLGYFFNLGLVGLCCFAVIIFSPIRNCINAAKIDIFGRSMSLYAFAGGAIASAAAIFFVEYYRPWLYIMIYTGISLRYAECITQKSRSEEITSENYKTDRPAN